MEKYCYKIPYYPEVEKAIKYALVKHPQLVSKNFLNKWGADKKLLPISILHKACEINRKDSFVPVKYQFTWFCLHRKRIIREQPSGRIFKPKVYFAPVYVEKRKELINFLKEAIKICGPKEKFLELIGYSLTSLNGWLNLKSVRKAPIVAYIKAAQLLKKNVWKILDGYKFYGKTSKDFILFKEKYSPEIDEILIWVEAEGTLLFNRRAIQIRQNKNGLTALQILSQKFKKIFGIDNKHLTITEDEEGQFKLNIYLSPLRQILCLRYNIPLGYKVYSNPIDNLFKFNNREEGLRKIAKHFETEGCISFQRWYRTIKPMFSISSRNEKKIENLVELINNLGWSVKKYEWSSNGRKMFSVCVSRKYEIFDLCKNIFSYLWHSEKKNDIIRLLNSRV